ncbi:Benzoyl-CoA reductase subunit BadG [Paramagnetospirillum magnetotacticum MS-1]|uniref:Benzoyl-CoA reductase subunit BadG n=1 Tax=Paramagnetospirillum magnetotacticum MS-1 TaxID=272627 RepID=A0A0C2V0J4_PARME|nr:benzoyl-CoA reductase subunit D [Paramagnetospirillum magnetotacticum]KIL98586.1 Benzoyl-CoA reductase subunit BadG [Paramagnetospirillum magnetotacticum MS-1]
MSELITTGVDIGSGCIKTVVFKVNGDKVEWLGKETSRIRNRDPFQLTTETYNHMLKSAGVDAKDVAYVASTGDAENLSFATGHFYSMTTHGRGGLYLNPEARAVLDIGALNGRAIRMDGVGKVLSYKMTSQCASGSGQFLENIARYLGIAQDEIGSLSMKADDPEKVSSICAVLAETDVINMVSRGISASNILKGIHVSMAVRLAKLLKSIGAVDGIVQVTGGLALDTGLVAALNEAAEQEKVNLKAVSHPDSIYAGAIGAALWGAFRHEKLARLGQAA